MAIKTESEDMILLLSGVTSQQDKLKEIYLERIKQTEEYKGIGNLAQYEFVTKRAKHLRGRLQAIRIEGSTISDIRIAHQQLIDLFNDFQSLLSASSVLLRRNSYHIDIISTSELKALKASNPDLYTKIQIKMNSDTDSAAEAFRNHIKTGARPLIVQEYIKNRTPDLAALDQQRAKTFLWGGAATGAAIAMSLLHFFLPLSFNVEMSVIGISFFLFFLGFFKSHWSLRFYTVGLLAAYMFFFIGAGLALDFGKLPETFDFSMLRTLHLYVLLGFAGSLIGMHAGVRLNFIPADPPFRMPAFFVSLERKRVFLTVAFSLFGFIWLNAFSDNATVYQTVAAIVESHIDDSQPSSDVSTAEALGQVTVATTAANLRTEPVVVDETIFGQVNQGTVLTYYNYEEVEGTIWYHVLEEESGTMVWISEVTVQE